MEEVDNLKSLQVGDMKIINLVQHDISIMSPNDKSKILVIPQSGLVARANKEASDIEKFAGFQIVRSVYGEITGLPPRKKNTMYVVSAHVLNVLNDSREDVVSIGRKIKEFDGAIAFAVDFRRKF